MNKMISGYSQIFNANQATTIANGASSSSATNSGGMCLVGVKMPAAFTGTSISFEICETVDGTYVQLYNTSGVVSYVAAASRFIAIDPSDFQGVLFFKVKSNASEAAQRTVICSLKGF